MEGIGGSAERERVGERESGREREWEREGERDGGREREGERESLIESTISRPLPHHLIL